jgi:hypothetical protein
MESSFLQTTYEWQEVTEFLLQVIAPTVTKYVTAFKLAVKSRVLLFLKSVLLWRTFLFTFLTTKMTQCNSYLGQ